MFKRVEKRRRKKEEEEELGLDEDMKEVLGMQDTDSDESDSDSDSERGFGTGNEDDGEDEGTETRADEGDEDSDESVARTPELSVQDTLEDPIYLVSLEPDIKACIVCPTKLLKHPKMIEVHKASSAHKRRFGHFVELARNANPDDNAWDILQNDSATKIVSEKQSRRSEKRKAKLAAIKVKREQHREKKAKAKAKQKEKAAEAKAAASAAPSESADKKKIEEPSRKKRKLDQDEKSKCKQHQPPPSGAKEHRVKGKIKFSAAGHKRGKGAGGKMDRAQKQGERKQKRPRSDDSVLKIFD